MKIATGNTIAKVVVVLLVTLGALGAIIYYSYSSYTEFSQAADELYDIDDTPSLTEDILTDISELESRSRAYSLTFSENDLRAYLEKVETLRDEIDSLFISSYGTDYHQEADTLRSLFRQKTESFENLIKLKISQSKRAEDRIALQALAQTQAEIKADSLLVPKQEIITTTVTETGDTKKEEEEEDEEEKRGLFQKIFGKKENKSVRKEVLQERTVAYDTAYFQKVDTLIATVKEAIYRAESQRRRQSGLLEQQELAMVANDQKIIDHLRAIALKIQKLENEQAQTEKQETIAVVQESFSSVILFAICGGILTILLIFLVIRDIWRNRKMQIELNKAKNNAEHLATVKEEFLANMSHEIRTPLNAIIGFSEQLASSKLDEDQKLRLNNVRSSSEHLLILVNDILDYSKIESGKLRLEEIGFKASTVIRESLATLEHLAMYKGIELRQDIEPGLEGLVLNGDPIRLKQILINLAGNGVKFTENGYVKISAYRVNEDSKEVQVKFDIEDTGKGIAPSKLNKIFEGFNQEDSSINRRYGGTGLGLTISEKLVQLQNGSISVESELGEGSLFSVVLPYEKTDKENYSGKFDLDRVEINLEGRSLLMIDDDNMNHVLLKPAFERWGLEFESSYRGDEGIDLATNKFYNYILIDLQMPGKSGLEVIKALRQDSSASAKSNLILCTANALIRSSKSEILEQVDATLLKPFKEYEVAALLAGFMPPETAEGNELTTERYSLDNFNAYAGNDRETLQEFIVSFIETNREHLELLEKYFAQDDCYNVGETAHKMKNTFGQLKAVEVMNQLKELEKLVNNSQPKRLIRERIDKTTELAEEIFDDLQKDMDSLQVKNQTLSP